VWLTWEGPLLPVLIALFYCEQFSMAFVSKWRFVFLKTALGHLRYRTPKNAITERNNLISFLALEKSKIGFSQSQIHFS
jgi:hypothetical protein